MGLSLYSLEPPLKETPGPKMNEDRLNYDNLKAKYEDLQKRANRFLKVEQDLINAKDSLDRELARFKAIQSYSEKALYAARLRDFAEITVESVIEAFEVECSAMLIYDKAINILKVEATFGFEDFGVGDQLDIDWMATKGLLKGKNAFIEGIDSDTHPWSSLGLCQVILCPYNDHKGDLRGFILAGRSLKKQAFYDEIKQEMIPSFTVFTKQLGTLLQNFESKEYLDRTVQERTEELKEANGELIKINEDLEQEIITRQRTEEKLLLAEHEATELSGFLKKMFGRYLSPEVMNSLLENPSALELGGERRGVTIMISDLRGFTAITERLEPEQVVKMLNAYFEVMVEVIHHYSGTINEIIGDSLLVIFGAPQEIPDRAQRAVACAIAMQNAMAQVNKQNRSLRLPELEMGIGLHDTEVIVGNIGSSTRIKYSVVGSGVNMTSRIESYTVGGQILISKSVHQQAEDVLRIDAQRDVFPKGSETPIRVYEVGGIAGRYNLALEERDPPLTTLTCRIPIRCTMIEGKDVEKEGIEGTLLRFSKNRAEITLDGPVEILANLKMNLGDVDDKLSTRDFYGKAVQESEKDRHTYIVRFTSVPPAIDGYLQALRLHAAKPGTN
ncbi:MAG: adenylate/guanylate cyclase domain-containing protein [Deltaproteobacteria bacterium]|nr:MAG: adenylate/guanylate cyclase domain-containing protein [Deltaproteobacteria bacterium]